MARDVPSMEKRSHQHGWKPEYCPTPEEITAECRQIQAEWSERERWRRAGYAEGQPTVRIPQCQVSTIPLK